MNSTTLAPISTTDASSIITWNFSLYALLTASLTVLIVGLPLSSLSFVGALKASIRKEATVIDWVIVFFNYGIIQSCLVGEGATLAQLISHLLESPKFRIPCIIAHFSKALGFFVVHVGLSAISVLRFVYVLYPKVGLKINAHQAWYKIGIPVVLTCFALAQNLLDYLYNEHSRYGFCSSAPPKSLKDMVAISTLIWAVGFLVTLVTVDLFLTAAIVNNIRKRNVMVAAAITEACPRQRQHNLLTIRGTILCRVVAILGYFAFFFIRLLVPVEKHSLRDNFYVVLVQMFITACNTVGLPLVCILQSPFIGTVCKRRICCKRAFDLP